MTKGFLNLQSSLSIDCNNHANRNNIEIMSTILAGEKDSPMYDYLLNYSFMRLSDIKSLNLFNYSEISVDKNYVREKEEILEEGITIFLPKIKAHKANIFKLVDYRASVREYSGSYINDDLVSDLLYYSFGVNKKRIIQFGDKKINGRNYASGGGLYPVSIVLYINRVRGIKKGFYRYQPYSHSLLMLKEEESVYSIFSDNVIDINSSNIICFFQADIDRAYIKYGELSLVNILIEIGLMSENLHLFSKGLGLSTCDIAGYNKKEIEQILMLDGINEHILYSVSIGD